jgi:hypothetical protein
LLKTFYAGAAHMAAPEMQILNWQLTKIANIF